MAGSILLVENAQDTSHKFYPSRWAGILPVYAQENVPAILI